MRQSERDLLMSYFVNEESRIEAELIELRNRIRFRHIDVNDCIELMLTLQRLDDFREFSLIVIRLLHLGR
jgi:hypothetical protein